MSFRLVVSDTVAVPVAGSLQDANGRPSPFSYSLVCRRLPASELRAAIEANEATVPEFLASVVQGWNGLQDDSGQPLPYSPTALEQLLDIVGMASVAFSAYVQACGAKGKEKN